MAAEAESVESLLGRLDEMADAISAVSTLDRTACREAAEEQFSVDRMTGRYIETYRDLRRAPLH